MNEEIQIPRDGEEQKTQYVRTEDAKNRIAEIRANFKEGEKTTEIPKDLNNFHLMFLDESQTLQSLKEIQSEWELMKAALPELYKDAKVLAEKKKAAEDGINTVIGMMADKKIDAENAQVRIDVFNRAIELDAAAREKVFGELYLYLVNTLHVPGELLTGGMPPEGSRAYRIIK